MYWPGLISWCGPTFSPRTLEGSSASDKARLMDMLYMEPIAASKCSCWMSDTWMLLMKSCLVYMAGVAEIRAGGLISPGDFTTTRSLQHTFYIY